MAKQDPTYREAAAEFEAILARLDEETEVDIDELAARVERAAELIRYCSEKLRAAELRVEKVTRELAGAAGDEERAGSAERAAAEREE